jgi:hypothetical protein
MVASSRGIDVMRITKSIVDRIPIVVHSSNTCIPPAHLKADGRLGIGARARELEAGMLRAHAETAETYI